MKAVSLMFHDAVRDGDLDESGFPGAGADLYKIDVEELEGHFRAVSEARPDKPSNILEFIGDGPVIVNGAPPLFITFDDGGVSAALYIADLLEKFGWTGHFFITTDYIDKSRFVTAAQVRELHGRGHIIGSHSSSHPERMSKCAPDMMRAEWCDSISRLSDILGLQVNVASVPGGFYSRKVAAAASACGIEALFTSEPVMKCYHVDGCLVLGRYTVNSSMGPDASRDLSTGKMSCGKIRQYLLWNIKKAAKSAGGRYYDSIRGSILKK